MGKPDAGIDQRELSTIKPPEDHGKKSRSPVGTPARRSRPRDAGSSSGRAAATSPPGLSQPPMESGDGDYITKSEHAATRKKDNEDTLRELLAAIDSSQAKSKQDMASSLAGVMQSSADRLNARLDGHDARIEDIEHAHQEMQDAQSRISLDLADAKEAIKRLERRLGAAESGKSTEIINNDDFDREIDKSFLNITAGDNKMFELEKVIAATQEWLEAAGINPDQYSFLGNNKKAAKRFKFKFKGIDGVAGTLSARAIRHLRVDGDWRPMECPDSDGNNVRIYVESDKSPKTRKTEIACRDLTRVLRTKHDLKAFPNKRDGTVTVDFVPIAQIVFTTAEATPSIYWNANGLQTINCRSLGTVEVRKTIAEEVFTGRKSEKIEWGL